MTRSSIPLTEQKLSFDEPTPLRRRLGAWVARWKAAHPAQKVGESRAERDLLTLGFGGAGLKLSAVYRTVPQRAPVGAAPNYELCLEHEYGRPLGEAGVGLLQERV